MGYLTFFQSGTQRPCLGWGCREMQLLLRNFVPARGCSGSSQAQWNREIISFLAEPKPVLALVKVNLSLLQQLQIRNRKETVNCYIF